MSHLLAVFSNAELATGQSADFKKSVNAGRLLDEVTFPGIDLPPDKQCRIRGWFSTPKPDHDPNPALRIVDPNLMDLSYVKDNGGMPLKAEHALALPATISPSLRKVIESKFVGGVVGGVTHLQQYDNGIYGEAELYFDEDPTSLPYQARKAVTYSKQGGPRIKTSLEGTYFKSATGGIGTKPTAVVVTWTPVNTDTEMEIAKSLQTEEGWLKYQEWVTKSFTPTYATNYVGMTNADALINPTFPEQKKADLIRRVTPEAYSRIKSYLGDDDFKTCVILEALFCPNDGSNSCLVSDTLLTRMKSNLSKFK